VDCSGFVCRVLSEFCPIGIYIGDNKIIHSASKRGVIVEDIYFINSYDLLLCPINSVKILMKLLIL